MDNTPHITWSKGHGHHPSEDDLLLYVDGELTSKEAASIKGHLEACWSCRVGTEKIQETISTFIDYRNHVLNPMVEPPPNMWRNFDDNLKRLAVESGKRSLFGDMFGSLRRFFITARLFAVPRPLVRVAAGSLVAILIAALVLYTNRVPTVSASELLRHATEAQATKLRATQEPVVHRKLQVRRTDQAAVRAEAISWETWDDTRNSRFRQAVDEAGSRRFLPAVGEATRKDQVTVPDTLTELGLVLQANRMDPQRPLSAASYQTWRDSVAQKQEEVTRARLSNGLDAFALRTVPLGQVGVGQISEATFVVRADDWHAFELRLKVRAADGERFYEVTEQSSEVLNLAAVSPEIFAGPQTAALPSSSPASKASLSPAPALNANAAPVPLPAVSAVATAELEVEVLRLLNQAGADLGEQVSARRDSNGPLRVEGIVETEARKGEILRALAPVINNPAVRVDIKTVAEALAEKRGQGKDAPGSVTEQKVEIDTGAIAAGSELRAYFKSDDEARQFAARMASRSQRAMRHLYAMRRLSNQFSAAELRALTPEARAKWLSLVRSHARAYLQEANGLRRELQPIFSESAQSASAHGGPPISDPAKVVRAVEELFALGSANDRVIRSAFKTSSESVRVTAINTGAFWQSLSAAEALAARIQSAQ
jgi:hypothetical protein